MFHHPISLTSAARILAATLLASCRLAGATDVVLDDSCVPQLSAAQQVIYGKAIAGTEVLRNYVWPRRFSLQLDVYETAVWAENIGKRRALCLQALAAHEATQLASTPTDRR